MWTPIERDDPGGMIHLRRDGYQAVSLHNLVVVVVRLRKHGRAGCAKQNATLGQKPVLGTVGGMLRQPRVKRIILSLRFGRHGRDSSVRRIDDERRPHGLTDVRSTIHPKIVVSAARQVGCATWPFDAVDVALFHPLPCERGRFLWSEKLLASEFGGP